MAGTKNDYTNKQTYRKMRRKLWWLNITSTASAAGLISNLNNQIVTYPDVLCTGINVTAVTETLYVMNLVDCSHVCLPNDRHYRIHAIHLTIQFAQSI